MDYGTFGTDSCMYGGKRVELQFCEEPVRKVKAVLSGSDPNITIAEVDPAEYDASINSGFV